MKTSLTAHILEHMSETSSEFVFEAFNSTIIQNIKKATSDKSWKEIFTGPANNGWLPMSWSNISDDDLQQVSAKEAKKLAKDPGSYILWCDINGAILGITKGDYVYSDYASYYSGGRRGRMKTSKAYKTATSIARDTTTAYHVVGAAKYSTSELRKDRWRSKQDATAFQDNWRILDDQRIRYRNILRERKNNEFTKENIGLLEKREKNVNDAIDALTSVLEKAKITQDWGLIRSCNEKVSTIVYAFQEMQRYGKTLQEGTAYDHYRQQFIEKNNTIVTTCKALANLTNEAEEVNDQD